MNYWADQLDAIADGDARPRPTSVETAEQFAGRPSFRGLEPTIKRL